MILVDALYEEKRREEKGEHQIPGDKPATADVASKLSTKLTSDTLFWLALKRQFFQQLTISISFPFYIKTNP